MLGFEGKRLQVKDILTFTLDCTQKVPDQVNQLLEDEFKYKDVKDKTVLIRLSGKMKLGKLMDLDMKGLLSYLYEQGAYFVMKNTSALTSAEFEEVKKTFTSDSIEEEVIKEHLGQIKIEGIAPDQEKELIKQLIHFLSDEKQEGETNTVFEDRLTKETQDFFK